MVDFNIIQLFYILKFNLNLSRFLIARETTVVIYLFSKKLESLISDQS